MITETIKVIKHTLQTSSDRTDAMIRIVPLGCLHIGHQSSLLHYAKGFIDYVASQPDTYAIIMGDLFENVLPGTTQKHLGSMWEQNMTPEKQLAKGISLFAPLVDKGKVLGMVEGNHSLRSWYAAGVSPERIFAETMGLLPVFAGVAGLMRLTIGGQVYVISFTHGAGTATVPAEVLKKLEKQRQRFPGADVYLRGHHHMKVAADRKYFDARTGRMRKVFLVGTGSFLGYRESYAERGEFEPVAQGAPKIKLYKNTWDVHVTL